MSVTINTNVDSIKIQNCLLKSTDQLSTSMERMSTGLKVNSAKDDVAGVIIAARMDVQLSGNSIAQDNVQSGNAMLSTAEGNIDVVLDNLVRIRDLTLQASNGTNSSTEITAMQKEVNERIKEINRISDSSKYASFNLFGSGTDLATNGAILQVGSDKEECNTIKASEEIFKSIKFQDLDKSKVLTEGYNLTTLVREAGGSKITFSAALGALDNAIDNISIRKSQIGSAQNRLASALDNLIVQHVNLSSAKSIIVDADIASEASKYTQASILQQVSTALLAQANKGSALQVSTALLS